MSETVARRPEFAQMVRAEVRRVLADPLFIKAPVQTRLLNFLAAQTIGGSQSVNQFTVAVDGLGKSESYDLASDSYPRVQISRLRKNLASYYARQQGGDGLCLYLRRGDYHLRLAPFEKAYPELVQSKHRSNGETNFSADLAADGDDYSAGISAVRTPALQAERTPSPQWRVPFIAGAIAALIVVLILILVYGTKGKAHNEPIVAIKVEGSDAAGKAIAANVAHAVSRELANSMVSGFNPDDSGTGNYVLEISLGMDAQSAIATLYDRNLHSLYVETYTGSTGQADLIDHLRNEVVYLTSRDGPIARAERETIGSSPNSAYECYLRTVDPTYEAAALHLTNQCLARFPDSRYRARWLGVQAFLLYQKDIAAGKPVLKSGEAWTKLQAALDANPREPFVNFVAAKVELAAGNCDLAERFVQRALAPGISYPALLVAASANASGCQPSIQFKPRADKLRALIRRTPTIDPFFQVNLILSALAIDQTADGRTVAQAIVVGKSSPRTARAADLISSALLQPGAFAAHQGDIAMVVSEFIWNPQARQTIMERLAAASPRSPKA